MLRTQSAFPFSGRRAINPTPPKRVKAWGDGPLRPEVMYPMVEHTRTNSAASNHQVFVAASHQTRLDTRSKARRPIHVFVATSHQTRLDTRSKARRPIKVGIKGRGRSRRSRDSNPACLCCSSAHLVQCEPDEASSFTNPNVGPGTYAS